MQLTIEWPAWMALRHMRDIESKEIAALGVCEDPDRPLHITRVMFPKQHNYSAFVEIDDEGLADCLEKCYDDDLEPYQCSRIWIHTHPGNSASPSGKDWTTFKDSYSSCDWAVMLIIGQDDSWTCNLRMNSPFPNTIIQLPFSIDWDLKEGQEAPDPIVIEAVHQANCNTPKTYAPVSGGKQLNLPGQGHFPFMDETYMEREAMELDEKPAENFTSNLELYVRDVIENLFDIASDVDGAVAGFMAIKCETDQQEALECLETIKESLKVYDTLHPTTWVVEEKL